MREPAIKVAVRIGFAQPWTTKRRGCMPIGQGSLASRAKKTDKPRKNWFQARRIALVEQIRTRAGDATNHIPGAERERAFRNRPVERLACYAYVFNDVLMQLPKQLL